VLVACIKYIPHNSQPNNSTYLSNHKNLIDLSHVTTITHHPLLPIAIIVIIHRPINQSINQSSIIFKN
jgi:hypothetical protein